MENLESDAFVFFGATGDLAYEQIFPALQAMITHGHFDMPIIGVAKSAWSLEQLRASAHESLEKHDCLDSRAFAVLSAKASSKLAVSHDDAGRLHQCSAVCTHLGCIVSWNSTERTWDCPCHGSRFTNDGKLLNGPALDPLAKSR